MLTVTEKACVYVIDGNERSLRSNTCWQMCIQPFCLAAVYTAAFAISSWASIELKFTPTRSCCCTRLAHFSGWASEPAGDKTSSLSPSCTHTICGNWLGSKRHVTHTTGDPKIHRHTITTHTCGCYSCVCHSLKQWFVEAVAEERTFIVHWDTHRQGGTKWQKVPGMKCTDVKDLKRNTGSI